MVGRRAWICAAVAAVLAGVLCLTVKEYGHRATVTVVPPSGEALAADSVALQAFEKVKSVYVAKGAALSTIDGDFTALLCQSIANPGGEVNKVLESLDPNRSILAMKKLCCNLEGRKLELGYFSYDSVYAAKAFDFFVRSASEGLPKGYEAEVSEEDCQAGLFGRYLPWRSAAAVLALVFVIWLLLCLAAWLRARRLHRLSGFSSLKAARKAVGDMLLGAVEEVCPFGKADGPRYRILSPAEPQKGAMFNVLGVQEADIHRFVSSGILNDITGGAKVNLMECGRELDEADTAYRFPDIEALRQSNSSNLLVMVHPPLSEANVPEAYLQAAEMNILVTDARQGWTPSYKAFTENIPRCKVVLTSMPAQSLRIKPKDAGVLPQRRLRFVIVLCSCYTPQLAEKTCRSIYFSSTGQKAENAEFLMEGATAMFDYSVRSFRASAQKIVQSLALSEKDADAVVMLKAGSTVSKNFLSDICSLLNAGADGVQCRLKGRVSAPKGQRRRLRLGQGAAMAEYGWALTCYSLKALQGNLAVAQKKNGMISEEFYVEFLKDTYVYFL